jgi:type VI secretion system protein ImpK
MPLPVLPVGAEAALQRFRQFYQELFTIKRLLQEGDWAALVGRRFVAGSAEDQVLLAVRLRLRTAIAAQGFGSVVAVHAAAGVDPGYVWTAVADAALLHDVDWPGRAGWAETPLEVVLYRSRVAGDRIFEAIEALTRRNTPDPDGVAITILLAFEMGFRGRYHGNDDHGEIDRLKAILYDLVFHAPPDLPRDFDGLTVGAAEPLGARSAFRLPSIRPWGWAIGGVAIGYLLVTGLIWWNQVRDIVGTARYAVELLGPLG